MTTTDMSYIVEITRGPFGGEIVFPCMISTKTLHHAKLIVEKQPFYGKTIIHTLYSFAKEENIYMEEAMNAAQNNVLDMFHLPLFDELLSNNFNDNHDECKFSWGGNEYSTKKVYI
jgi:hypothetical protein